MAAHPDWQAWWGGSQAGGPMAWQQWWRAPGNSLTQAAQPPAAAPAMGAAVNAFDGLYDTQGRNGGGMPGDVAAGRTVGAGPLGGVDIAGMAGKAVGGLVGLASGVPGVGTLTGWGLGNLAQQAAWDAGYSKSMTPDVVDNPAMMDTLNGMQDMRGGIIGRDGPASAGGPSGVEISANAMEADPGGQGNIGSGPGLSDGGWVTPPQGGPDPAGPDDQMRPLQTGEFVVNAGAAAKYGPVLRAINAAGLQRDGGYPDVNRLRSMIQGDGAVIPPRNRLIDNPVGTQSLGEQSMTNPTPGIDPVVMQVGGQPVTLSQFRAIQQRNQLLRSSGFVAR